MFFIKALLHLYVYITSFLSLFRNNKKERKDYEHTRQVWYHTPDLGELRAALALLTKIREEEPYLLPESIYITVAKHAIIPDPLPKSLQPPIPYTISHLPPPTSGHMQSFLASIQYAVFIEEAPQPLSLLVHANRQNIPMCLLDARPPKWIQTMSPWKNCLQLHTAVTSQSSTAEKRLGKAGVQAPFVPSLKFLRRQSNSPSGRGHHENVPARRLWLAASTHKADEKIVFDVHAQLMQIFPDLLLILVPRNISRVEEIAREAENMEMKVTKRSQYPPSVSPITSERSADVHIIDTFGELAALYNFTTVALMGNTFENGADGHNFAEAAHGHACVIRGPMFKTFEPLETAVFDVINQFHQNTIARSSTPIWNAPIVCARSAAQVRQYVAAALSNENDIQNLGDIFAESILQLELIATCIAISTVEKAVVRKRHVN